MYDTILVPTDGSEGARGAARHAVALATAFDGDLHLLSVADERSYGGPLAGASLGGRDVRDALEREATEAVRTLEERVAGPEVTCHAAVEHGVPHDAILSYAGECGADLIAMGTRGRTGLERYLLGSVTERVVRTSDVPVLASRPGPDDPPEYERVLVRTDGSEEVTAAIEHGVAVAARFGATVHALSVVDVGALTGANDAGPGVSRVAEALTEGCEDAVAAVAERCESCGVDVVTEVAQGSPRHAIGDYVENEGIDLAAMGTHDRTGLERYLVGSVTERVVRTSDAPVLTVR